MDYGTGDERNHETHELVKIGVVWKQSENRVRNANSPLSGQIEFDFSTDMRFKT